MTQLDIIRDMGVALIPGAPRGREIARFFVRGFWLVVSRHANPTRQVSVHWHDLNLIFDGDAWRLSLILAGRPVDLHSCQRPSEAVACFFAEMALTEIKPLPAPPIDPPNRHWRGPYATKKLATK